MSCYGRVRKDNNNNTTHRMCCIQDVMEYITSIYNGSVVSHERYAAAADYLGIGQCISLDEMIVQIRKATQHVGLVSMTCSPMHTLPLFSLTYTSSQECILRCMSTKRPVSAPVCEYSKHFFEETIGSQWLEKNIDVTIYKMW